LRHISKQGNVLLRLLLVEAAQAAARFDPEWHKKFSHLAMRRERQIAKVAMARKLADPNCCPSQRLVVDLELRADSLVLRRQTVVAEP
jgi:hypothetical protein